MSFEPGPWPACDVAELALSICLTERGYIGTRASIRRHSRGSFTVTSAHEVRSYLQAGTPFSRPDFDEARRKVVWADILDVCAAVDAEPGDPITTDQITGVVEAAYLVCTRIGDVNDAIGALGDRAKILGDYGHRIEELRVRVEVPNYFENAQGTSYRYIGLADDVYPLIWFISSEFAREQSGREYVLHKVFVDGVITWKGVQYTRIKRSWFELAT
ncbi:hypothetical protein E3_0830 [Rhodococcus phage E3]|uniref:hypothetical protein n=1 Tax=Rhodococcus phage E3 TaxID=1007869 RepID=UPI0002C6E37C|nr:hypothetical protein M176_gp087 [Rhodococcus phage E3]AEQ20996.1 hypothetical protein E3_0830 [Rhodococcus phage E3]